MENQPRGRRCLICRRLTPRKSLDFQTLVSNKSLLQDFLNCFHIKVLDSQVKDLSTLSRFCSSCEKFIAEWSNIQTQMTQLTRRAVQLEATLSARLLSAPQIHEQNHDQNANEIAKNKIQNSQHAQLQLLLQQTVHDIRNELLKKYSARVMLDRIRLPSVLKLEPLEADNGNVDETGDEWEPEAIQLPVEVTFEPLSGDNDKDDENWEHWLLGVCDEEYIPSRDELEDEKKSGEMLGWPMETEEEANCSDRNSQHSVESKKIKVKTGNVKINIVPVPRYRQKQPCAIRVGPNKFKYNGYDVILNDEDQCYYCGVCNLKGVSTITSILGHIRFAHYTEEDKAKFTAVKTSDTEWLHGGKYEIIKVDDKFKCVSCGSLRTRLDELVRHIRSRHIDCPDPAPKKKNPCEICGVELSSKLKYRKHIKFHKTGLRKCPTCDKEIRGDMNFKRHIQLHELREEAKKLECGTCGESFLNLKDCKDHALLHASQKSNKGEVFGEKSSGSSDLTWDPQSAHEIQERKSPRVKRVCK